MKKPDSKSTRRNPVMELVLASILMGLLILTAIRSGADSAVQGDVLPVQTSANETGSDPAGIPAS